ncbi:MAG: hypothetical protein J6B06_02200 [Lachnospiraceae bacterium]|nr:hypothetical protein [Lachnospiraceae bacterium]
MKKYTIVKIYEQDFGCEGLPAGQKRMDDVVLRADDGSEVTVQIPDDELYAKNLNEGDEYWME